MKMQLLIFILLILGYAANSQMVPDKIVQAFEKGDAKTISTFFNDNLEMKILDEVHVTSRNQAARILQDFFKTYPPLSFKVNFEGTKKDSRYGLSTLVTKGGTFMINLYFMDGKSEKIIYYLTIEKG